MQEKLNSKNGFFVKKSDFTQGSVHGILFPPVEETPFYKFTAWGNDYSCSPKEGVRIKFSEQGEMNTTQNITETISDTQKISR